MPAGVLVGGCGSALDRYGCGNFLLRKRPFFWMTLALGVEAATSAEAADFTPHSPRMTNLRKWLYQSTIVALRSHFSDCDAVAGVVGRKHAWD